MKLSVFLYISLSVIFPKLYAQSYNCFDIPNPSEPDKHVIKQCPFVKSTKPTFFRSKNLIDGSSFNVNFKCDSTDSGLCQKAQSAFEMAGQIISSVFMFEVPITLNATFSNLNDSNLLGSATPSRFIPLISEDGVPRLYPQSLVKQFKFNVHPEYSSCDIYAQFNSGDGPISPTQQNIHTVILHELFHGLGFTSSWRNNLDSLLQYPSNGLSPVPYLITSASSKSIIFQGFIETIFDKFLVILPDNTTSSPLVPTSLTAYTSKLNEFGPPPTEFSSSLKFAESLMLSPQWNSVAPFILNKSSIANTLVFLPRGYQLVNGTYVETSVNPFLSGSSISHVSFASYTNSQDFLMRYKLEPGFTIEDLLSRGGNYQNDDGTGVIGPRLRSIMESIGYKTLYNPNPIIPKVPSSENVTIFSNPKSNITFQGPFPPIIANSFSSKQVSDSNKILNNCFTIWNCIIMILGLLFVRWEIS
ncbi:sequence orphan [Gigaspora margarita]|uniref:Sequence orphan n=1 Tax=Gigaspora margarita TaxID=4874 RepID=A0A8H4EKQ8_GIGMA|nr:sequence orphan [Gigaspora margarita]